MYISICLQISFYSHFATLNVSPSPQAKEAELQIIDKLLEDSSLTPQTFRQWKEHNEDLYQEIEKLATQKKPRNQTAQHVKPSSADDDGACRLSLSDGEQLVDAELPSDGDSTPNFGRENLAGRTDPRGQRADSSYSENYFFI